MPLVILLLLDGLIFGLIVIDLCCDGSQYISVLLPYNSYSWSYKGSARRVLHWPSDNRSQFQTIRLSLFAAPACSSVELGSGEVLNHWSLFPIVFMDFMLTFLV